jgi:phage shock protein PspC (stress-responsive transcriptional regulator)
LHKRKTVVTEAEIQRIIKEMGSVEPAEKTSKDKDAVTESGSRQKRLYTLREGAMIGGVCNGLASYFNMDVTVVRLIFVLLLFMSAGFWILVYILAMLLMPEARTPEQRAELRGETFSAQDVLKRAKQKYADVSDPKHWQEVADRTKPALSNVGRALLGALRIVALALTIILSIGVGILTALWLGSLWWLMFGHPHFTDQLSTISSWTIAAGFTAVYLLVALPMLLMVYLSESARKSSETKRSDGRMIVAVGGVLWMAAWAVLICVGFATYGRIRDFQASHGYVNVGGSHNICVNEGLCNDPDRVNNQRFYRYENGHLQEIR